MYNSLKASTGLRTTTTFLTLGPYGELVGPPEVNDD